MNILITGFNRPGSFKLVLDAVEHISYENLFLSLDAPKPNDEGNKEKNNLVRSMMSEYAQGRNNVHLIFYEINQGCRKAVSQSITKCFTLVEDLIILEDDCLPLAGFFEYCEWAISEFRTNHRIGSISSQSFLYGKYQPNNDIYFSKYHHCWGWATWKRSWVNYNDDATLFSDFINTNRLNELSSGEFGFVKYWRKIYIGLINSEFDSWAYRWLFSCWKNEMLSVIPRFSLVKNIGFNNNATHTTTAPLGLEKNYCLGWSPNIIKYQKEINRDMKAERIVSDCHYYCWSQSNIILEYTTRTLRQIKSLIRK